VASQLQDALLAALATILRPTVKLLLHSGVSYSAFASVAKSVFVQVATEDHKRRGRLPNFSEVSAMTGISRREVSRIRKPKDEDRWTPSMETSPINTILHEWHFDADFSDGAGGARPLPFEGDKSFSLLVSRYVTDIPPGAMRATLLKAGVVAEDDAGRLVVLQPFFYSRRFDEDFVRGLAFSSSNLGSTLFHNAVLHQRSELSPEQMRDLGRLERGVWSEHLTLEGAVRFMDWVKQSAPRFLADAEKVIGENELPQSQWAHHPLRAIGVGIYYYEED
jgi:hypothetical protein